MARYMYLGLLLVALTACKDTSNILDAGVPDASNRTIADTGISILLDAGPADTGIVKPSCTSDEQCAPNYCDVRASKCVQCRFNSHCADKESCLSGRCVSSQLCLKDDDCLGLGMVCNTVSELCVQCNSAADCEEGACIDHVCRVSHSCRGHEDCNYPWGVCDPVSEPQWPGEYGEKACVECRIPAHCEGRGGSCFNGFCVDLCEYSGRICGRLEGRSCGGCPVGFVCGSDGRACLSEAGIFERTSRPPHMKRFPIDLITSTDGTIAATEANRAAARLWMISTRPRIPRGSSPAWFPSPVEIQSMVFNYGALYISSTSNQMVRMNGGRMELWREFNPGSGPELGGCYHLAAHQNSLLCDYHNRSRPEARGLYRLYLDQERIERVAHDIFDVQKLLADGDYLIYSDGRVGSIHLETGQRTILVPTNAVAYAAHAGWVYYLDQVAGILARIPVTGGVPEIVAGPQFEVLKVTERGIFAIDHNRRGRVVTWLSHDGQDRQQLFDFDQSTHLLGTPRYLHEEAGKFVVVTEYGVVDLIRE